VRDEAHSWTENCEKCPNCGKTRSNAHDWSKNCEECAICGSTRSDHHDYPVRREIESIAVGLRALYEREHREQSWKVASEQAKGGGGFWQVELQRMKLIERKFEMVNNEAMNMALNSGKFGPDNAFGLKCNRCGKVLGG
jgi:hypothetical protein